MLFIIAIFSIRQIINLYFLWALKDSKKLLFYVFNEIINLVNRANLDRKILLFNLIY